MARVDDAELLSTETISAPSSALIVMLVRPMGAKLKLTRMVSAASPPATPSPALTITFVLLSNSIGSKASTAIRTRGATPALVRLIEFAPSVALTVRLATATVSTIGARPVKRISSD